MGLAEYIRPGGKIDIQDLPKGNRTDILEIKKVYISQVSEILSEDRIEITMPMVQTKLILLEVDEKYDLYFYTPKGVYQVYSRVVNRYKKNNLYYLEMELTSKLCKVQRREYYRYGCAMEMRIRTLEPQELKAFEKKERCYIPDLPEKNAIIVDISGGGIRFVSKQPYELQQLLYCSFTMEIKGAPMEFHLISKVLAIKKMDEMEDLQEYRVQFYSITKLEREDIIRYIFEEERKNRQREKW
ncbi:MAG: flagellar brake domain-containing protein [Lachnospiraceae bacterium]